MELSQLLNAIVEVSHSVARIPCNPDDKKEVLDKIKDLFSVYTTFLNASSASSSEHLAREQTPLKQCCTTSSPHLDKMQEKIQNIDEKLCTMDEKLNRVERQQEHKGVEESITSLRSEIAEQAGTVRVISKAQDGIYNRVTHIENKSNDLELLQSRIEEISGVVQGQPVIKELLEELIEKNTQGSKDIIAFSASALSSLLKYKPENVILFNDVNFNFYNCFDPLTSIFTTKLLGLYVFSTSINTNSNGEFEAAIVHNNVEVALFGTPGTKDLQTGTSIVLWLNPEDVVCVRVRSESDGQNGIEVGGGFSNFIGYKIA